MRAGVPRSAADLTAEWLGSVMAPHSGGARLLGCDRTAVGTGQVAATYRIAAQWDRPTTAPSSLIVKVTSDDATSREAARSTRTYEIEACFYNELAGSLAVRAPRCFYAAHEAGGDGYVVVLEDLAPARQGDQIAGCTTDEAVAAIDQLPRLHAPRWGDPALAELPWLDRVTPEALQFTALVLGSCATGFLERYSSSIDDDILALVDRLIPRLEAYLAPRPRPWTVAHGDFRLDNLLFGNERVAVVDWQTVIHGPGVGDLVVLPRQRDLPRTTARPRTGARRLLPRQESRLTTCRSTPTNCGTTTAAPRSRAC